MVIFLFVLTLDINMQIAGLMGKFFKKEMLMWLHIILNVTNSITMISPDCRSMMDTSMKQNNDIIYKNVWKIKQEHVNDEQMNEGHLEVIPLGLEIVWDQEKSLGKNKYVKYRKVWRRNKKQEEYVNKD